jgi:flagellar P-ring protein FlgI
MLRRISAALTLVCLLAATPAATAQVEVRIKDITDIEGIRGNKLTGMGLVTGLNGTGGRNPVTRQFATNMLQNFGLRADPAERLRVRTDAQQRTDSLSVVTVTAELPPFARQGSRIDVLVSTFDDATSLQGGQLVLTPLFGVDNEVYAVADGPVSIGGFSFSGQAAQVQKNHPTTGRIPNGATVERKVSLPPIGHAGRVRLLVRGADLETARRIAQAINDVAPRGAFLVDAGTIEVIIPPAELKDPYGYLSTLGQLRVRPDTPAKVVINERTGTIVIGDNVRLSRVAITHANLAVITGEMPLVSQPAPFSDGATTVVPRTELEVIEETSPVNVIEDTATVGDLAQMLNALGVSPRDMSSIFQQLKQSGALHAELEFK